MALRKAFLRSSILVWIPFAAMAQSISEFENLTRLSSSDLTARLMGKTFTTTTTNGTVWNLEYKSNGYMIVTVRGTGGQRNFSKPWRVEDSKICSTDRGVEECKPARLDGSTLVVQITPTETTRYTEQ